jgi:ribosome-associated translation inhibitor RaiA
LRVRAEQAVERAAKIANRPQSAEVIFDADHGNKVVELKLFLPRGIVKVASAEDDNFRTALDRAADKIRSQLSREPRKPAHRSNVA